MELVGLMIFISMIVLYALTLHNSNKSNKSPEYYIRIAKALRYESTCLKRRWSVVCVKDFGLPTEQVIATGVNISRDGKQCKTCARENAGIGGGYELCPAIHAECNGARNAVDVLHSSLENVTVFQAGDEGTESFRPCIFCGELLALLEVKDLYGHAKDGSVQRWNHVDCYGGLKLVA